MTLRLPPKHVVFPPMAIFRQYPLPPDLWETWSILRGLAWVNQYAFTPPCSLTELLPFHHDLKLRALEYRLQRLEATGWLTVRREAGKRNVYTPSVPADRPIDYSMKSAVHGGEPASLRGICPEDSARREMDGQTVDFAEKTATPAIGCTSPNSSSSVLDSEFDLNLSSTTSTSAVEKILQTVNVRTVDLDLSGMDEDRAQAIADYIAENPDGKNSPAGFAYACLRNNPDWQPPQPSKPVHWYAKYSHLVSR